MKKILSLVCVLTMFSVLMCSAYASTKIYDHWKHSKDSYVIEYTKGKATFYRSSTKNGTYKKFAPMAKLTYKGKGQVKVRRLNKTYYVKVNSSSPIKIPKVRNVKGSYENYVLKEIQKGKFTINLDGFNVGYGGMIKSVSDLSHVINFIPFLYLNGSPEYWQFANQNKITCNEIKNFGGYETGAINYIKTTFVSPKELAAKNKAAKKILNKKFSGTDFEKFKKIHNWLIKRMKYKGNTYDQCIYSVTSKKTVCAGFASMFQYMCNYNGLTCETVYNNKYAKKHAWNQVKLKGKWYVVDVTWDNTIAESTKNKYKKYTYFLVSDKKHNDRDKSFYPIYHFRGIKNTYKMRRS